MHLSVYNVFPEFTAKFEGNIPWMYLDVKGLVTVGFGCLVDPCTAALRIPFSRNQDNKPASVNEITREWSTVKKHTELAVQGHTLQDLEAARKASRKYTTLHLSSEASYNLMRERLIANEKILKGFFPLFDDWPADAQLPLLSMAWAMGPSFPRRWPRFRAACRAKQWGNASVECLMRTTGNPGLIPRNKANVHLFKTAAEPTTSPPQILRGWPWP